MRARGPARAPAGAGRRAAAGHPALRALAAALPLLSGCLVAPCFTSARTGALLPRARLEGLRAGTTREEVLEAFGPPLAVVRRGDGAVWVPDVGLRTIGGSEILADRFFDRFAGLAAPGDVVYFYRAHELRTSGSGVLLVLGNSGDIVGASTDTTREDRLWILLDGETGAVKAHVHERDEPEPPAREDDGPGEGEEAPG